MIEKFPLGARVTNVNAQSLRATVVARPLKLTHVPDSTPIVQDGHAFVTFWRTNQVRLLTPADFEPSEPSYLAEIRRNELRAGKQS